MSNILISHFREWGYNLILIPPQSLRAQIRAKDDACLMTSQHNKTEAVPLQSTERPLFPLLLAFACIFEFFYLTLVALSPLAGLHLTNSPLSTIWSKTFLPSHWLYTVVSPFIHLLPHRDWFSSLLLGITFLGIMGTYACAITLYFSTTRYEQNNQTLALFHPGRNTDFWNYLTFPTDALL